MQIRYIMDYDSGKRIPFIAFLLFARYREPIIPFKLRFMLRI